MTIWAALPLISSIIIVILSVFIYNLDIKSTLNRTFFLILITCFIWSFSEFQYRVTDNYYYAIIWVGIAKVWIFSLPLSVHFIFVFVENYRVTKSKFFYILNYIPILALYLLDVFDIPFSGITREYWGFSYFGQGNTFVYFIYLIWTAFVSIAICFICLFYTIKLKNIKIFLVMIAAFIPVSGGVITEVILPFNNIKFPELTSTLFIVFLLIISFVIWKYHLFIPGIEKTVETIFNTMSDVLFILSRDLKIKRVNRAVIDLFGYTENEILEKDIFSIFIDKENKDFYQLIYQSIINNEVIKDEETIFIGKNNKQIPVSFSCSIIKNKNKLTLGILLIVRDITKRKSIETILQLMVEGFTNIVEKSIEGVVVLDKEHNMKFVNPTAQNFVDLKNDIMIKKIFEYYNNDNSIEIEIFLEDGNKGVGEVIIVETKWEDQDAYLLMIRDITKRKIFEDNLKKTIQEKEILLSEVHHRIKNNLQIVMSLLKLPIRFHKEKIIEEVFVEAQNRIKSMAIIHEMLYNKKDFVKINIKEYLVELTNYILNTFKNELTIELELLFEDFSLNIDYSITIGLIVTELFTNTIKYAFTDNERIKKKKEKYQRCVVSIELKRYENICYLIYKDNGKGLSKNIDDNDTLGVHLINLLVKGRLNGTMEIISNKGLEYIIKFVMK